MKLHCILELGPKQWLSRTVEWKGTEPRVGGKMMFSYVHQRMEHASHDVETVVVGTTPWIDKGIDVVLLRVADPSEAHDLLIELPSAEKGAWNTGRGGF